MRCPVCEGKKVLAVEVMQGDPPGPRVMTCVICKGDGSVDNDFPRRQLAGEAFRHARVARSENLYDCAKRLGVTTPELSQYEHGVLLADAVLVKIEMVH